MNQIEHLYEFSRQLRLEDVPDEVVHHARQSLINVIGVTLGGLSNDATQIAIRQSELLGGAPQAHALGTGHRTSTDRAGLINGIAAHVLDYDDTHLRTVYHPTAPLIASIVPLAEQRDESGAAFLEAWIVGLETGMRFANALGRPHYDLGWHITSTAGFPAAALGCARLLGLDADSMRHAVGIAATQSSGHRQQFGAMTKSFHAGMAGSGGILAALLAADGYTADRDSILGRRGLLSVMSPEPEPDALSDGLGETWVLLENCLKPYASGVVTHPLIDAGRELRDRGVAPGDIDRVDLLVHPLVMELTNIERPSTGLEAKFSVRHCFAVGLLDGAGGPDQFTDQRVAAADAMVVRESVDVADGGLPHMQARAEVRLSNGASMTIDITEARGTIANPLSDDEVAEKYRSLARGIIGEERTEASFAVAGELHNLPFRRLVEVLTAPE